MAKFIVAMLVAASLGTSVHAQAPAAPVSASAALNSATTPIGDLLDNPEAKAVLAKYLPEVVASDQLDMARAMSLKDIQSYAPDQITDAKLAEVDAELAKVKPAK